MPRPATQSIAFGTVRWYFELDACLARLLDRPGAQQDPEVRALLLTGLYQLLHAATPEHAAVSETVEAARALGRPRAAGLVNAVLRRFQRERESILAGARGQRAARHAHAEWMLDAFARDWPEHWESIAAAGNAEPPMWLRVNARHGTRDAYRARLADAGFGAEAAPFAPEALRLAEPMDVHLLPGFAEGDVSVQDVAAQLAPAFLAVAPGMRVLDACAAPGGKACHLLEREPGIAELVALDVDRDAGGAHRGEPRAASPRRRASSSETRQIPRSGGTAVRSSASCSTCPVPAPGVIRRHPDIKLLRRAADIPRFAAQQSALLRAAWGLLAPGGRLAYASCSILAAENARCGRRFPRGDARGGRRDRIC